jgi:Zn-dependent protease
MSIDILQIILVLAVVLLSMTLHEAMHAFASYWLGDDTAKYQGRLTLNPIKHIDPFLTILLPVMLAIVGGPIFGGAKPVPFNPNRVRHEEWGVAIVGAAGPLTNLLIAFVGFGVYVMAGLPGGDTFWGNFLHTLVVVNLGFFIFNSLPIPPLDGSRVLYALAPDFVRRGMEWVEQYGLMIVFGLVLLAGPLLSGFMLGAIQFFINVFSTIFFI